MLVIETNQRRSGASCDGGVDRVGAAEPVDHRKLGRVSRHCDAECYERCARQSVEFGDHGARQYAVNGGRAAARPQLSVITLSSRSSSSTTSTCYLMGALEVKNSTNMGAIACAATSCV